MYVCRSSRRGISAGSFLLISIVILGLTGLFTTFLGLNNFICAGALGMGIGLSLFNPVAATSFFTATLFLRPWEGLPHNVFLGLLPRLLAGVTAACWLFHILTKEQGRIVFNFSCWVFIFFLGWLLLGALIAGGESVSFFFDTFPPIAVLAFLILNTIKDESALELFTRTLVVSVLGVVVGAVYMTMRYSIPGQDAAVRLHSVGLWGNANDLAALITFILPLCFTELVLKKRRLLSKIFSFAGTVFLLGSLFWSQSRGALAAIGAACLAYFAFCTKTRKTILLGAALVISIPLLFQSISRRGAEDLETSTSSRTNYLIAGLRMAKDNPVFGVGINNYASNYERYTPAFFEWGRRTAHSSWVLALAEGGVVGLGLFSLLFLITLKHAWRLRRRHPQYFVLVVSYGTAMSFLSHTYLFLPYIMMAFVMAAARIFAVKEQVRRGPFIYPLSFKAPPLAAKAAGVCLILFSVADSPAASEAITLTAGAGAEKPIGDRIPNLDSQLKLYGSRGETLIFLLRAEGSGCHSLSAGVDDAEGGDFSFTFYSLPPIKTEHPSFPGAFVGRHLDPVVLINSQGACLDQSLDNWFLGEVEIARDASPGLKHGLISLGEKKIELELKVWRMTIPANPALPAYAEMTPWFNLLGHYGKWTDDEARLANEYSVAMYAHRIYPLKSTIAPLEIDGDKINITDHPSPDKSFRSVVLKNRPAGAYYDFPTVGASGFEPIDYPKAIRYFKAVENTIADIARPGKAIVYLWDEPKPDVMSELIKLSTMVKAKAPSLKQMVTITYDQRLADTVSIFNPVINYFDHPDYPRPEVYRSFQEKGGETWWYVSCMSHGCEALIDTGMPDMVIDRPSAYVRAIGWLSMRYNIDAFLYYSVNNGYQYYPKRDPWQSLWDFSGNGDGTLFYPGRPNERGLSAHVPVASLRLKLWRESSYDAEYIRWMEAAPVQPSWWQSEYKKIAQNTGEWARNYQAYAELRKRAGEFLDSEGSV